MFHVKHSAAPAHDAGVSRCAAAGARPRSPWATFPCFARGFAVPWVRTKDEQAGRTRGSSRRREETRVDNSERSSYRENRNRGRGGRRGVASTAFSGHGHHPAGRRDHGEACAHGRPDRGAHPQLRADVAARRRAQHRDRRRARRRRRAGEPRVGQARPASGPGRGRQVPRPGGREPAAGGHAAHLRARGQPELRQDHAVQPADRLEPARGQLSRRDGGSQGRLHQGPSRGARHRPAGHLLHVAVLERGGGHAPFPAGRAWTPRTSSATCT